MSISITRAPREEGYVKHIDEEHSVRIIVRSAAEERNAIRRGAWRSSLCGCPCSGSSCVAMCCLPWLFPCVTITQVAARIGLWSYGRALLVWLFIHVVRLLCIGFLASRYQNSEDEDALLDDVCIDVALGISLATSLVLNYATALLRHRVRLLFAIPGSLCCDCLLSCCFSCCALGQLASHVKLSDSTCCCVAPDTLPAYDPGFV